jgi:hypothetical protein
MFLLGAESIYLTHIGNLMFRYFLSSFYFNQTEDNLYYDTRGTHNTGTHRQHVRSQINPWSALAETLEHHVVTKLHIEVENVP